MWKRSLQRRVSRDILQPAISLKHPAKQGFPERGPVSWKRYAGRFPYLSTVLGVLPQKMKISLEKQELQEHAACQIICGIEFPSEVQQNVLEKISLNPIEKRTALCYNAYKSEKKEK